MSSIVAIAKSRLGELMSPTFRDLCHLRKVIQAKKQYLGTNTLSNVYLILVNYNIYTQMFTIVYK